MPSAWFPFSFLRGNARKVRSQAIRGQTPAWHEAQVSNGPTEAVNNLIKRVKRGAFGFRRFKNYRIRALLYAGKPDWSLLGMVGPP